MLEIALEYMERLANFSSWEVSAAANDEMPISHTLVGLATAFDFLYNHLTMEQRDKYFKQIRRTTLRNFKRFKRAPWGQQHLQNHVQYFANKTLHFTREHSRMIHEHLQMVHEHSRMVHEHV